MSDPQRYTRDESEAQRLDRNFGEQLQELRIAQAGVQILFAFLLSLPFQQRFTTLTDLQRNIYVWTLMAAAVSVIVFTAPVALHRTLFRDGLKDFIVAYTDRLIGVGLFTLGMGIIGGVILILDVLMSHTVAFAVGAVLLVLGIALWLGVPLSQKGRARRRRETHDSTP
ncbi:DUF6328 family protein [Terrabacter sp. MAHUQ-38]|uniref:DUF6328 family protein n=1 Tax=unclassified Terrabacter TaxID=2630222 RepID=UPI00165D8E60|nr:DUF6328 family protein [Terrabacter sp. MAHUQ-38]MBC9819686.1 hypothetical protein [Terrabacter sp. MAHUQ-38]